MHDVFLVLGALITVLCAVGVVASREAVHSALFLTAHLLGVGSLFLALTHQFLAVAQLLVYAGAVMVVFMFAVTTLAPKEDPLSFGHLQPKSLVGLLSGAVAFAMLMLVTRTANLAAGAPPEGEGLVTIQQFALDLFGPFLLPFEGTAFLLLVALVGAMILGGRRQLGDG
jgi:NADH-quinone oxidoreductase subunit J